MRPLAVSLLTLSFVAAGPLTAAAMERGPVLPSHGAVIAVDESFTQKREEYQERAQRQMDEWGHKMRDAAESAKANGRQLASDAQAEIDRAWADTKEQWAKLQHASADGWERARIAYEHASRKMQDEWNKFHPSAN
ncbi:MAG TPA: hypothetical protein VMC10_00025 [Stellaceae bacterium]|nr:hypothetical protein [Stellaceae bacterium]